MDPQVVDHARKTAEAVRHAQEQIRRVLVRSAVDMDFRRQLLSDPHAALQAAMGITPPASLKVRFIESEGYTTIVLPDVALPSDVEVDPEPAPVEGDGAGLDPEAVVAAISAAALRGLAPNGISRDA